MNMLVSVRMRRSPRLTLFPYTTLFRSCLRGQRAEVAGSVPRLRRLELADREHPPCHEPADRALRRRTQARAARSARGDRKSTRLNSSHVKISYAVFCLKKKTIYIGIRT